MNGVAGGGGRGETEYQSQKVKFVAVSLIPQFHILCQKLIGCVMEQFVQLGTWRPD